MTYSDAQWGPEAILTTAGKPLRTATHEPVVVVPSGYVATWDTTSNLTIVGPPANACTFTVDGVEFTVPIVPKVSELAAAGDVSGDLGAVAAAAAAAVAAEASARTAVDAAEQAARLAADADDETRDAAEEAARIANDAAEASTRAAAVAAEASARAQAVTDEATQRAAAVAAEAAARSAADSSLQASITANTSAIALKANTADVVPLTQRGAAGGVATLDGGGTVPDAQIPATITRDSELSAAIAALVNSAPGVLDTLGELAAQLQSDESAAAALTTLVASKAPLASPALTGTPTVNGVAVALLTPSSVDVAGTAYTTVLTDAGKIVRCTNAAAVVVTVPPNSDVAYPVNTVINVYAAGAAGVTIAAGAGVTIRNNAAGTIPQYRECSLRKDAANEWVRLG